MTDPTATPAKRTQVNSATLIMGVTGSGKSSLLETLARWLWVNYHMVLLLYTLDGGGYPARVQAAINKGLIRLWRCRTRSGQRGELALETCARATQGWWPVRINPRTGETDPNVPLVSPYQMTFVQRCANGHVCKTVKSQSQLTPQVCPTCQQPVTPHTQQVEVQAVRNPWFADVGAVAYDSLSSMCSWGMSDLSQRAGSLELKGEEGSIGGKVISGDMKWGSANRSHYGFVQSRAEEFVLNSLGIPGLVVPPIFTALIQEATDQGGLAIAGPQLSGQAKTHEAPQWFGNALETAVVLDDKGRPVRRLYLSEYLDDQNRRHLLKNRGAPGTMPPALTDPAEGEGDGPFSQFHLGLFFDLLARGVDRTLAEYDKAYPDAPGVPEGIVDIGEQAAVSSAAVAAVAAGAAPAAGPVPVESGAPSPSAPAARPAPAPSAPVARRPRRPGAPAPAPPAAAPVAAPAAAAAPATAADAVVPAAEPVAAPAAAPVQEPLPDVPPPPAESAAAGMLPPVPTPATATPPAPAPAPRAAMGPGSPRMAAPPPARPPARAPRPRGVAGAAGMPAPLPPPVSST